MYAENGPAEMALAWLVGGPLVLLVVTGAVVTVMNTLDMCREEVEVALYIVMGTLLLFWLTA